ncbi:hypothetical protein EGM88_03820 [Aureibaculum marinum]|uniref:AraC effector-binding domain-containing protein n=2 Tax=Pseudomonadati TaxID=3379134 RepID=A0A3N4NTG9_9FLAO|nr:SRPBCC family protein [Aureibaculum marinum]RPD99682.1 hypothetical protein EGM88_03820 [Aureibaculum marinum]
MKVLKYILLLLLLMIVAGSIYIATLENNYHVKRTRVIEAPAEVVFDIINDYKSWPEWSPWLGQDPNATVAYGAKTSGVGATYSWSGEIIGEGNMETLSVLEDSISQKITFIKPWESSSNVYWKLNPKKNGTVVTWGMTGELDFKSKAFMAFNGGIDKQVGPDYVLGLIKLDSVVNAKMQEYSITVNGVTTHGGGYYLYQSTSCKMEELPQKFAEMMPKVISYVENNNITTAGPPFTIYHTFDSENNAVIMSVAVPVTERVITSSDSGILTGFLKPFIAVKTTLKGDYKNSKEAWNTAYKYIGDNNLEQLEIAPAIEVYLNTPSNTANPANLRTEIFVPIKEEKP